MPVIFLALLLTACQGDKPKPLKLPPGQVMPELALLDTDAKPQRLAFNGTRTTVLNIWATWCGPCRHEMPSLQRLADLLDSKRFQVIGISVDNDNHIVREYLIDKKIHFKNYMNPDMSIANDVLGIRVYPSTYIIDRQGVIRHIEEGWRDWDKPDLVKTITQIGAH